MAKKKKVGKLFYAIFAVFIAVCLTLTLSSYGWLPFDAPSWESIFGLTNTSVDYNSSAPLAALSEKSEVHFVDCGQGDCEIILSGGIVTVIDAGPKKSANSTLEYIQKLGVTKIDNLVLTHAHEDHIGGAATLINKLEIGKIYMSKPKAGTEPTTNVYLDTLKAIADNNLTITTAKAGMSFNCGDFEMSVISPSKDYDELNNQSVVIHAVYDDVSFLFTGDAESQPCNDMLKNYPSSLDSTVLKVGHHGSKTSSSEKFLKAVSPAYAVISCGENNSYSHPHGIILNRLQNVGAKIYRTDLQGNIVMMTNGKSVDINVEKADG